MSTVSVGCFGRNYQSYLSHASYLLMKFDWKGKLTTYQVAGTKGAGSSSLNLLCTPNHVNVIPCKVYFISSNIFSGILSRTTIAIEMMIQSIHTNKI